MSDMILLVDDHEANRAVLRRRLERRGFAVVEASDGDQAVARFCERPPGLVIMDLSMPGVSGFEALERIRGSGKGPRVPVVALTAHALETMKQRCREAGFSGFYAKPIDFETLVANIGSMIADQQ
jgi:CheY-like chemotaxis protein